MDPNDEVALENIFSDLVSQYGKLYGQVKLANGQTCLVDSDSNSTIVYYISKASIDDSPRFHCMVKPLRAFLKTKKVIFKHIKNPDGTYAVY